MKWTYQRLEDGKLRHCPTYDYDGSVTGKIVVNVPAYFDENPDEARRLGWTKHITHDSKEIREIVGDWNPQTQYLVISQRQVDEWTVEDVYHVMDKSEEMMLLEELSTGVETMGVTVGGFTFFGGDWE